MKFQIGDRVICNYPGSWLDKKIGTIERVDEWSQSDQIRGHYLIMDGGGITIIEEHYLEIYKPPLMGLFRDNPETPEGKYLVKRRDGSVVEWPSFVLGARDPHAPAALRSYATSMAADPSVHPLFVVRLRKLADEFDAYRLEHGDGDPAKGQHRKDDHATVAEMKLGRSS